MIKIVTWILVAPIAAAMIAFAVYNRHTMHIDLWPLPWTFEPPVYLVVYGTLLIGFLLGGLIGWMSSVGRRVRKAVQPAPKETAKPETSGIVVTPPLNQNTP